MGGTKSLFTTGDVHNRGLGQGVTTLGSPSASSTRVWLDPGMMAAQGFSSHLQHELPAWHDRAGRIPHTHQPTIRTKTSRLLLSPRQA